MGPTAVQHVTHHSILEILYDSIKDQPQLRSEDNEVRYKLVIDSSEDNSLLRLLFAFGVLKEKDTRTYMCSDFPGDSHQQTVSNYPLLHTLYMCMYNVACCIELWYPIFCGLIYTFIIAWIHNFYINCKSNLIVCMKRLLYRCICTIVSKRHCSCVLCICYAHTCTCRSIQLLQYVILLLLVTLSL